jgi:BR serine/threonine kinase
MPNKATIDGAYRRSIPSEYFFTKSPSTSPRSFTESDTRLGPFIYDRVLGKGCSGTVMLATHCDTKFKVAIKIVDALELKKHPATWSKIQREIAILKLMDHPNVMKLYDCLETDTKLYMICEYVSGGELFDYIVSGEDRSAEKSLSLIAQIVTALCYCTEFHVCHRDLKPENMFMDGTTTQIKLGDFGLARMTKNRDGEVSTSCGSPHYAGK